MKPLKQDTKQLSPNVTKCQHCDHVYRNSEVEQVGDDMCCPECLEPVRSTWQHNSN